MQYTYSGPPAYQHTQVIPVGVFWTVAIVVGTLLYCFQEKPALIMVALITALYWFVFARLTVSVNIERIQWWFGCKAVKQSVPLETIVSYAAVRNRPLCGWGIHCIGPGWLYNVYGLSAVELVLPNSKIVRLGTDEPDKLVAVLDELFKQRKRVNLT